MSVKLIDNEAFYGYRVRRTVAGTLYQEYFSLKHKGKRAGVQRSKTVERQALRRDEVLKAAQARQKKRERSERCFHEDGSVRGISYLVKTEKSGTRTPIFQVGIASDKKGKIICTSFSINAHGKRKAWEMAIDSYIEHKQISKSSKLYKQLLKAMPNTNAATRRRPKRRSQTA